MRTSLFYSADSVDAGCLADTPEQLKCSDLQAEVLLSHFLIPLFNHLCSFLLWPSPK